MAAIRRVLVATRRRAFGPARRTAVIVPVPEAEPAVGRWRRGHDPSAAGGVPAHVTILYPFAGAARIDDELLTGLGAEAAQHPVFEFRLGAVGSFPDVVYLAPEPAGPFIALTQGLVARWPAHQPYGGAFDEVVPHLTVAHGREPAGLRDDLTRSLPIEATARRLALMAERSDGTWTERASFPLGGVSST